MRGFSADTAKPKHAQKLCTRLPGSAGKGERVLHMRSALAWATSWHGIVIVLLLTQSHINYTPGALSVLFYSVR
ncbi:hypothetical protein CYMTET_29928 [Cymbomonas tetramitiformis]|uniref:Uncharacterized protein n=1 Tax=Cymbomonas tetramitiformis TaxID=36881 RepID=A0AAE0KUF7_9CHLO|nr:hypothetical protein CYMTET_29928 [Cymbomonas tetramitiformis]